MEQIIEQETRTKTITTLTKSAIAITITTGSMLHVGNSQASAPFCEHTDCKQEQQTEQAFGMADSRASDDDKESESWGRFLESEGIFDGELVEMPIPIISNVNEVAISYKVFHQGQLLWDSKLGFEAISPGIADFAYFMKWVLHEDIGDDLDWVDDAFGAGKVTLTINGMTIDQAITETIKHGSHVEFVIDDDFDPEV